MRKVRVFVPLWCCVCLVVPSFSRATDTLSVQQAVRWARESHPHVSAASAIVSSSRGEFWSAISPPPSTVGVEYEGVPRGQSRENYSERRVGVSQGFEFPLKYLWRGFRGYREVERAGAESQAIVLDLESSVRLEYVATWVAEQRLRLLEESAALAATYAQQSQRREELGEIAPLEARRAQVEALQVQRELERERRSHDANLARLGRLIGKDLRGVALVIASENSMMDTLTIPTVADTARNPELNGLKAGLRAAGHGLTLASLSWLPDMEIGYFRQRVPADADPEFWGLEVGFSLPVWFWLGGRGDLQTAKAQKKAAAASLQARRLEISSQWDTQRQEYFSALEQVQIFNAEILPLARESYDLARRSFTLGEASYLEVLDAQRSLLQAQLEHLESVTELQNSRIILDRLAGRSLATDETR